MYVEKNIVDFDLKHQKTLGKDAIFKFHDHFMNLKKVKDQNNFNKNDDSMFTKMFKYSQKNHLLPKALQIVKWEGDYSTIDLKGYRIGDSSIDMLSQGLSRNSYITGLHLSDNRISNVGAVKLVSNLSPDIEHIDLSYNKIRK